MKLPRPRLLRYAALALLVILAAPSAAAAATYQVQKGDTLFLIARRFGLSTQQIIRDNRLPSTVLYPGQTLWVPDKSPPSSSRTYTVRPGDSLFTIAQKFGLTVTQLQQLNGLKGTAIKPGQVLNVGSQGPALTSRSGASTLSQQEYTMLARLVHGEARGEPFEGQVAVAAVVLNRLKSPVFPKSIAGIIFEPWAFTAVQDGQYYLTPPSTAYRAVDLAVKGWDPTKGALYYWNPRTATNKWIWSRRILAVIGNHLFGI